MRKVNDDTLFDLYREGIIKGVVEGILNPYPKDIQDFMRNGVDSKTRKTFTEEKYKESLYKEFKKDILQGWFNDPVDATTES